MAYKQQTNRGLFSDYKEISKIFAEIEARGFAIIAGIGTVHLTHVGTDWEILGSSWIFFMLGSSWLPIRKMVKMDSVSNLLATSAPYWELIVIWWLNQDMKGFIPLICMKNIHYILIRPVHGQYFVAMTDLKKSCDMILLLWRLFYRLNKNIKLRKSMYLNVSRRKLWERNESGVPNY